MQISAAETPTRPRGQIRQACRADPSDDPNSSIGLWGATAAHKRKQSTRHLAATKRDRHDESQSSRMDCGMPMAPLACCSNRASTAAPLPRGRSISERRRASARTRAGRRAGKQAGKQARRRLGGARGGRAPPLSGGKASKHAAGKQASRQASKRAVGRASKPCARRPEPSEAKPSQTAPSAAWPVVWVAGRAGGRPIVACVQKFSTPILPRGSADAVMAASSSWAPSSPGARMVAVGSAGRC